MAANVQETPSGAAVAAIFRPRTLNHLASGDPEAIQELLAPLASLMNAVSAPTVSDALNSGLCYLGANYRNEYYYKNVIISKIVFGRHRPTTSSALVELPTRSSIADVVVLNGTSTAYEIKTDLDSFDRLSAQIESYQSCFEHVNVVTSERRAAHAAELTPEAVGVLALRTNGALAVIRPSAGGYGRLRPAEMFEVLRQAEASRLLRATSRFEIDVPPGHAWSRYKQKFLELELSVAHRAFVSELRRRGMQATPHVQDPAFPQSLRALAYASNLTRAQQQSLLEMLDAPMNYAKSHP